jgi:REP element-mobilizing transposase RayT
MARKVRIEYPGAIYHVMNRGDRKERIFNDDSDRLLFLETLEEACEKTDWQIHSFCLMENHFHLVPETPLANLVTGMKWLLGTYTNRFNRKHNLSGHVFGGRYKAIIVDGSGDGYLKTVCDYVHLNPVRAQLIEPQQKISTYPWSSYLEYLKPPRHRRKWLRVDRLLGEWGIPRDSAAGRKEFERQMELRRMTDDPKEWNCLRRGWCFGNEAFRRELLEQVDRKLGADHYGQERRDSSEAKAERILAEELRRLNWTHKMLSATRKGEPAKLEIAHRLRTESTMSLAWIADRLQMGTRTHLDHLLYWRNRK